MDKWLQHTVGLVCIYLIVRKVKQAVIGLRLSCIYFHHCDLCVQTFNPFLHCVCGLFVTAFTGALNVRNKHTVSASSVIMSAISFQFAVCPLILPLLYFSVQNSISESYICHSSLSPTFCGFMF